MKKGTEYLFPINLLSHLKQYDNTKTIIKDRLDGIEYALGTLSEIEKQWISLRFREGRSVEDVASALDMTAEQEKKLRNAVIRKLRGTSRWDWIRYGIEGNVKRIKEEVWTEAYQEGYRKGLEVSCGGEALSSDNLAAPITILSVPGRVLRCLKKAGFITVASLLAADRYEIMRIAGMGKKGRKDVVMALRKLEIGNTNWE